MMADESTARANIVWMKAKGWSYSARQIDQGPWEAVFMFGDLRCRGEGQSLAEAVNKAVLSASIELEGK